MKRKLKDFLKLDKGDTILLILSLLLSFSIWLMSNLNKTYTGTISVPVIAVSNIDGHSDVSTNTATAVARCRTSGFNLVRATWHRERKPVRVNFNRNDLHPLSSPEDFYITGPAMNGYVEAIFGNGAEVEGFVSDSLLFHFTAVEHKKVPVVLVNTFSFRSQYMATGPIKLTPDSVTVYADAAHLESIDRIHTAQLSAYDIHNNLHGTLRLSKPGGVRLSDDHVDYQMGVSRYVEVKATKTLTLRNAPAGKHVQIFPSTAEVTFKCLFPLAADPSDVSEFYIDYKDFAASIRGRCIPKVSKLPSSVISWQINPEVFDCIEVE